MWHVFRSGSLLFAAAVVGAALIVGCGRSPGAQHGGVHVAGSAPPRRSGHPQVPRAALHLQLAKEELGHAGGLAER